MKRKTSQRALTCVICFAVSRHNQLYLPDLNRPGSQHVGERRLGRAPISPGLR